MRIYNKLYIYNKNGKVIKKLCHYCGLMQSTNNYHKPKSRPHGLHPYCKKCRKIQYKLRWESEKERSSRSIAIRRFKAFEIIANGRELSCVAHNFWNCCGDSVNALYLSLDHIENDGYIQKKELNTTASTTIYNWVIKNPELARKRLQILCMNAQTMKKRIFAKSKIVVYFPQIVKEEEE